MIFKTKIKKKLTDFYFPDLKVLLENLMEMQCMSVKNTVY